MADVIPSATAPVAPPSMAFDWVKIVGAVAVAYLLRELLTRKKSSNPKRRRRSK